MMRLKNKVDRANGRFHTPPVPHAGERLRLLVYQQKSKGPTIVMQTIIGSASQAMRLLRLAL
ncbi:MAG: hypothetical protein LBS19_06215 [Clostridiales bacterium]|nr:hypothetical protein [Clostridiales bacterium]